MYKFTKTGTKTGLLFSLTLLCSPFRIAHAAMNAAPAQQSFFDRLGERKVAASGAGLGAALLLEILLNKRKRDTLTGRNSIYQGILKRLRHDKDMQWTSAQGVLGLLALILGGYELQKEKPSTAPAKSTVLQSAPNQPDEPPLIKPTITQSAPADPRPATPEVLPQRIAAPTHTAQSSHRATAKEPIRLQLQATPQPRHTPSASQPTPHPRLALPVTAGTSLIPKPKPHQAHPQPVQQTPTLPIVAPAKHPRTAVPQTQPTVSVAPPTPQEDVVPRPAAPVAQLHQAAAPVARPDYIMNVRERLRTDGISEEAINAMNGKLQKKDGTLIDQPRTKAEYSLLLVGCQTTQADLNRKTSAPTIIARPAPVTAAASGPVAVQAPLMATYPVREVYAGDIAQFRSTAVKGEMAKFLYHTYGPGEFYQRHFEENDTRFISPTDTHRCTELAKIGADFSYQGEEASAKLFKIPFAGFQKVQPNGYCGYRAITGEFKGNDGLGESTKLCQYATGSQIITTNADGNLEGNNMLNEDLFDRLQGVVPAPIIFLQPYGHTDTNLVFVYENGISPTNPNPDLSPIILLRLSSYGAGHFDRYVQGDSYDRLIFPNYDSTLLDVSQRVRHEKVQLITQEEQDTRDQAAARK